MNTAARPRAAVSTVAQPGRTGACWVAALAGLPGMGPATLAGLLERLEPEEAWAQVRAGRIVRPGSATDGPRLRAPGQPRAEWASVAARLDPESWWSSAAAPGIQVTWPGQPDYPPALMNDPQRPGALFYAGTLEVLDRVCVAIVGTRDASPDGIAVAFAMGRDLASAGVCVVSGLALGIDGAAHAGALGAVAAGAAGSTLGVAASGVDVPSPRRHTQLWRGVTRAGAVVSENLPGRPAQAWRFPSRNRIIAGLVSMVVVVESPARGGSLITAEAAMTRGVEVRVVPGPVRSPSCEGSNQLLYDGPGPVRNATDVLDTLGIVLPEGHRHSPRPDRSHRRPGAPAGSPPERVLSTLGARPATLEELGARTGLGRCQVMSALAGLVSAGEVLTDGIYWRRAP